MKKLILSRLSLAIVVGIVASCQTGTKEDQKDSGALKDTVINQDIKSAESSYAEVNGLKMYYEVSGDYAGNLAYSSHYSGTSAA